MPAPWAFPLRLLLALQTAQTPILTAAAVALSHVRSLLRQPAGRYPKLTAFACRFRGVSKKKGKWEAKVMVNRRWAYRELFDRWVLSLALPSCCYSNGAAAAALAATVCTC
jgi:hypothetical protein